MTSWRGADSRLQVVLYRNIWASSLRHIPLSISISLCQTNERLSTSEPGAIIRRFRKSSRIQAAIWLKKSDGSIWFAAFFSSGLARLPMKPKFLTTRGPNMSISWFYRPSTESIGFILKWIPGKHRGRKLLDEDLSKNAVSRKFGIHNWLCF